MENVLREAKRIIDEIPLLPPPPVIHERRKPPSVYSIPGLRIQVLRDGPPVRSPDKAINHPRIAAEFARRVIGDNFQEHLVLIVLDKQLRMIGHKTISVGTFDQTSADPADIMRIVVNMEGAAYFMIVHNHPSGEIMASGADVIAHKNIMEAGRIMHRPLLDAIIIGKVEGENYYSAASSYDLR